MMKNSSILRISLLFLSLHIALFAIEAKIRVSIPPQKSIYVSQKIGLSIELLSSAFSVNDVKITFTESEKYLLQAPQSASYLGQEEVGEDMWQMLHYDYELYALESGKIEIPPIAISFTASMGYGQPKQAFEFQSKPLFFEAKTPKGVIEDTFVLVTDRFLLQSTLTPHTNKIVVGDAVVLSVIQKANGVPDLLLMPTRYNTNAHLRVYSKEPLLQSNLKGDYDVSRTEQFTFVATLEGNVTLPTQTKVWYNPQTHKVDIQKIPSLHFEILPNPQIAIDAQKSKAQKGLVYILVVVVFFGVLYLRFGSRIRTYNQKRKEQYKQSETAKFERLMQSLKHNNNASLIYDALYEWLYTLDTKIESATLSHLITLQPSLKNPLGELEEKTVNPQAYFDRVTLASELQKLRKKLQIEQEKKEASLPNHLNPMGA